MSRAMSPNGLFAMETHTFWEHRGRCSECARFVASDPATAALLCLDGAILLKQDEQAKAPRKPRPIKSQYWAGKNDVKRAMRYKE